MTTQTMLSRLDLSGLDLDAAGTRVLDLALVALGALDKHRAGDDAAAVEALDLLGSHGLPRALDGLR